MPRSQPQVVLSGSSVSASCLRQMSLWFKRRTTSNDSGNSDQRLQIFSELQRQLHFYLIPHYN